MENIHIEIQRGMISLVSSFLTPLIFFIPFVPLFPSLLSSVSLSHFCHHRRVRISAVKLFQPFFVHMGSVDNLVFVDLKVDN